MDRSTPYAPVVPLRPMLRPPGGRLRLVPPLPRQPVPWGRYGAAAASVVALAVIGVAAVLRPAPMSVQTFAPPTVPYVAEGFAPPSPIPAKPYVATVPAGLPPTCPADGCPSYWVPKV